MGLLDQILGSMAAGQGGLGGILGGNRPAGQGGNAAGGGLGGLLGEVLGSVLAGQQGPGSAGGGQSGQPGVDPLQPQGSNPAQGQAGQSSTPRGSGGGFGGPGGLGGLNLNPILMAVLGILASRAIGGMMQSGGNPASANPAGNAADPGVPGSAGGGFGALFEQFSRGGMGAAFESWVGPGTNQAVDASQLEQLLGPDSIQQIARQLGISNAEAMSQVAQVLPEVVDRLTPGGQAPAGGFGDMGAMLQQLLRPIR